MDLKAVIAVALYYTIIALTFVFGVGHIGDANSNAILTPINATPLNESMTAGDWLGNAFEQIARDMRNLINLAGFMFFAVGLPSDTPDWLAIIMHAAFTIITIVCSVILANAIWGGGGGH